MGSAHDTSLADTITSQPEAQLPAGLPPATSERYELKHLIARGGQAEVYLAFDHVLGREVAFKTPRSGAGGEVGDSTAGRFLREARITARLDHPNVITVHEIGRLPDGRRFCTMRLVRGEAGGAPRTLGQALRDAKTPRARLALLPRFLDVCNGVAHAHERGVVHRDLKPDNVVLGGPGETVVLDWGLARDRAGDDAGAVSTSSELLQTVDGQVFGTPLYMSPEHARGQRDLVDERSDVWSLGVMLFELLTGATPFTGTTPMEVVEQVRTAAIPSPAARAPGVPRALAAIVQRALARDRQARYPSAAALAADVRAFLENRQVGVYDYSLVELVRLFVQRYRTTATVSAIALVLLVAALVAVAVSRQRTRESLAEAFVEKGRLAEAGLQWNEAAVWYAAALDQRPRLDATFGLRLAWQRASAREVTRLAGQQGSVRALAASRDGRWLASGGTDRVIRVWDLSSRRLVRELAGHEDTVTGLVFSPVDGALFSTSEDDTVRRWAADSNTSEVLTKQPDELNGLALSRDGALLAVACENAQVLLIDLATKAVRVVGKHTRPVYALSFSPDGREVASGSWLGDTLRWRVSDGAVVEALNHHAGAVLSLAFSPDGSRLASAGRDTAVRVVALGEGLDTERVRVLTGHTQKVYSVAWSSDGEYLASAGSDGTVRLWNGQSGAPLRTLSLGEGADVAAVTFVPGTHTLAWAGNGGSISLRTLPAPQDLVASWDLLSIARLPDERLLVSTDRSFAVVDPSTGLRASSPAEPPDDLGGQRPSARLVVNPSGTLLVGRCATNCLAWWDLPSSTLLERVKVDSREIEGLALSPDGRLLVTASRDPLIRVWDNATHRLLRTLDGHREGAFGVAFSPDGRLFATCGYDKQVIVWETASFTEVRRLVGHEHGVRTVQFSPDSRTLAGGSWDRTVRLWDVATGAELARLRHQDFVFGLDFRPDGKVLATGSHDGTVRLWDMATRREVLRFLSDEARVTAVRFSSDGRTLHYAGRGLRRIDLGGDGPLPSLEEVLEATALELDGVQLKARPPAPTAR